MDFLSYYREVEVMGLFSSRPRLEEKSMNTLTAESIIDAIVKPFTAAAEIATAIDTVATALDGARTVVLILENTTHHPLELVANSHEHGGFDVTPALIVPKRSTAVF